MDNIREIIETFSADDIKEFRTFINRQKKIKERKDLQLFDILCEDEEYKPKTIIARLYSNANHNAYHSIRKRLLRNLMEFIVLKRMDSDTTTASYVMGMITLAQYLLKEKSERLAWTYIKRAEELAFNNEQYDLLNNIYNIQIENASSSFADDLDSVIQRRNKYKLLADEDERAIIANSLIQQKLQERRVTGADVNFEEIVANTLEEYHLKESVIKRPKLLYTTISIVRSVHVASKDFHSFEAYIIGAYNNANEKYGFNKPNHIYKLYILYMICHVLYRNRKFDLAIDYLNQLHDSMMEYQKSHFTMFYPKFIVLLAAIKNYQGKATESIDILTDALAEHAHAMGIKDNLNITLNLAVYYFNTEDFNLAIRTIINIPHTDRWCEKKLGKEWLLRKNLIELIIQYELSNFEIVLSRVRAMEKHFRDLFKLTYYKRVRVYLDVIKSFVADPHFINRSDFYKKAKEQLAKFPRSREDTQAMAFYCWLKSKADKRNYYEVLLEMVNNKELEAVA